MSFQFTRLHPRKFSTIQYINCARLYRTYMCMAIQNIHAYGYTVHTCVWLYSTYMCMAIWDIHVYVGSHVRAQEPPLAVPTFQGCTFQDTNCSYCTSSTSPVWLSPPPQGGTLIYYYFPYFPCPQRLYAIRSVLVPRGYMPKGVYLSPETIYQKGCTCPQRLYAKRGVLVPRDYMPKGV